MWVKIKCPACQTESSSWLLESSYEGQHRCWKCKALYEVEVNNGELISCKPMTEGELATLQARQEAKKKGLDFAEEPASSPSKKSSQPLEYSRVPAEEPAIAEDRGADFAALARSSNLGLEFSKAETAAEAPSVPVQTPLAWPKAPDAPDAPVVLSRSDNQCAGAATPAPVTTTAETEPKIAEATAPEGTTCKIDSFNFGFIVVGGKQYNHDVDILPDGQVLEREPGKGRIGSHAITRSQLEPIVKCKPQVILVGTGTENMAKLSGDVQAWQQRGTDAKIVVMPSSKAVKEFNELAAQGKRVAALIHITC